MGSDVFLRIGYIGSYHKLDRLARERLSVAPLVVVLEVLGLKSQLYLE